MGAPTLDSPDSESRAYKMTQKEPSARELRETTGRRQKRRKKLTPKLIRQFCLLIRNGLPFDACCDMLEIASMSFWEWQKQGELYINGEEGDKFHKEAGDFLKAIRKAFAEYRYKQVKQLNTASSWPRNLAILERRDRKNFGVHEPQGGALEEYDPDERFL